MRVPRTTALLFHHHHHHHYHIHLHLHLHLYHYQPHGPSSSLRRFSLGRPSPLVRFPPPLLPDTIPEALFPNTLVWRVKHRWYPHPRGAPRFVLLPTTTTTKSRGAGITRLPPPTSMLSYVQVVSTPTADTPGGCLVLHFDNRRYLFGRIAEGTQRTMIQRKIALAKIHDIFLTGGVDYSSTGGLLGMILTIADLKAASSANVSQLNAKLRGQGKAKQVQQAVALLNIHGGKNLVHMLATARGFILRKGLPVHPREVRHDPRPSAGYEDEDPEVGKAAPDYEDENIRVWSIPISKEPLSSAHVGSGAQSPKKRKLSQSTEGGGGGGGEDSTEEADQTIRESVVRDMFSSKWNLDTLRETRIRDVQLPAKMFVRNDKGHLEPYTGPGPDSPACPDINVLVRLPWPAARLEQLPLTTPSRQSMCYIVKNHPRRGKFNVEAAVKLGVAKTDFRKLTAGESVTGKDGVTVTPDMVLGIAVEARGFAVVDLPSADLIDDLVTRHEWSNLDIMRGVDVMYWILSDNITVNHPTLQQFMKARPSIKHIVLGSAVCPNVPALESPMAQLIKMNSIDGDRFPLPVFDTDAPSTLDEGLQSIAEVARPGLRYQLAPKAAFVTDTVVPVMDTAEPVRALASEAPQVLELAKTARAAFSDPEFLAGVEQSRRDLPSPETEIIPLGTGSALPSKYRNVSATLIRVPTWGSYLLDCGENTLGQLRRRFGYEGADEVLKDLRAIYISHAHADHHLGTISVIARWRELPTDNKLVIIATKKYHEFLREFQMVQALSGHRLVHVTLRNVYNHNTPGNIALACFPTNRENSYALDKDDGGDPNDDPADPSTTSPASYRVSLRGLPGIEACFVDHCYQATAVVLTFPDTGLKIAYSGDCRPSETFAELAKDATLLIHECTFDDELAGDALAKKHSTLSEALGVARQMRARRVLLTHFSQRYPKLPVIGDDGEGEDGDGGGDGADMEVLFAFDLMRVKLGEFKQAKQFLPALRELLREEEEGAEGVGSGEVEEAA